MAQGAVLPEEPENRVGGGVDLMPMKLLVRLGDKVIAGLILLFVIYQLVLGLQRWVAEPELTESVKAAIDRAEKSSPKPKFGEMDFALYRELQGKLEWKPELIKEPGRPLQYNHVTIDTSELQNEYAKKLSEHEHLFFDVPNGEGRKHCAFPGCPKFIARPDVYIGAPVDLALGDIGVMSVEITWKEPNELKDANVLYCVIQRAIVEEGADRTKLNWAEVTDDEGVVKKIYGARSSDPVVMESEDPGFVLPEDVELVEEPVLVEEERAYRFLDFNLDPSTQYAYRVRAVGDSDRKDQEGKDIEGVWGEILIAMTKKDQGVGFSRYIPGLRGKDGEYKLDAKGNPISRDKVYVRVRKLFDPPWSSQRYFIEYEHRNIIPNQEGMDAVGKVDPRFRVKTSDGNNVYIDRRKENFLYVSEERSEAECDAELKSNSKNWKEYKLSQDFTTQWVAVKVIEEVVEEMGKVTKYDAKGESRVVTSEDKKYRYFLVLKDTGTDKLERLELEREKDELSRRLRTD